MRRNRKTTTNLYQTLKTLRFLSESGAPENYSSAPWITYGNNDPNNECMDKHYVIGFSTLL